MQSLELDLCGAFNFASKTSEMVATSKHIGSSLLPPGLHRYTWFKQSIMIDLCWQPLRFKVVYLKCHYLLLTFV